MDTNLTVNELMQLIKSKISSGELNGEEIAVWNHRTWGHTAICGIGIVTDKFDFGSVTCVVFKPAKFVPPEETPSEGDYVSILAVAPSRRFHAIRAYRFLVPGSGLAEAKQAIERIAPGHPVIVKNPAAANLQAFIDEANIAGEGIKYSVTRDATLEVEKEEPLF